MRRAFDSVPMRNRGSVLTGAPWTRGPWNVGLFGITLFLLGCAGMTDPLPSTSTEPAAPAPIPLPAVTISPELTQKVRTAEEIGRYIFMEDVITAKAHELILQDAVLREDARRQGWIVVQDNRCALVRFFSQDGEQYVSLYNVCFMRDSMTGSRWTSELTKHDVPMPLPPAQQNMVRARQLAIASLPERCSDQYRLAMVPGNLGDQQLWAVYLIAVSGKPGVVMAGGHVRIAVSADGRTVLRADKLSDGCLQLNVQNGDPVAITESVFQTPTELHVYLNRIRRSPIYVGTGVGLWKIQDGRISLLEGRSVT